MKKIVLFLLALIMVLVAVVSVQAVNVTTGVKHFWPLNDANGSVALDTNSSGVKLNLSINGVHMGVASAPANNYIPDYNFTANFVGSSSLSHNDNDDFTIPNGDWMCDGYVNHTGESSGNADLLGQNDDDAGTPLWRVEFNNATLFASRFHDGSNDEQNSIVLPYGAVYSREFNYFAIGERDGNVEMWWGGVLYVNNSNSAGSIDASHKFVIGAQQKSAGYTGYWSGKLSQFACYSYALAHSEIAQRNDTNMTGPNFEFAGPVELTLALDNSTYNVTSATFANNATIWRTEKLGIVQTNDSTPTVTFDINEVGDCAISKSDLNYSDMLEADSTTICSTTNATSHTCTLPVSQELVNGTQNIFVGCADDEGNDQGSNSTSEALNIRYSPAVTECGTISESKTLVRDITATGGCFTFGASDITLDCDGFEITWDSSGTGANAFTITDKSNVEVKDCIIRDINAAGANGLGMALSRMNGSRIINNSIFTNGTSGNIGILLQLNADNNNFTNNTITAFGTSSANYGMRILTQGDDNQIIENIISTDGTGSNFGMLIQDNSYNNTVRNNTITTGGSANANYGIYALTSIKDNIIENNVITTNGTQDNYGINLDTDAFSNDVLTNTILTSGSTTGNFGLRLVTRALSNNVTGNKITATGTSTNPGIVIQVNSDNNTIMNNTISTVGTTTANYGIYVLTTVLWNVIKNNVISTEGTSSNFGALFTTTVTDNIFEGNTITTNGSGASNYGVYLTSSASRNNVSKNTILTNGSTANYGVMIESSSDDNLIEDNNITTRGTGGSNFGVRLVTSVERNSIKQNRITTTGTTNDHGIVVQVNADNGTVEGNIISTDGTSSNNYGIYVLTNTIQNNISNNHVRTNGTANNFGIRLETNANNNVFESTNISTQGTTSYPISVVSSNGSLFNQTFMNDTVDWIDTQANTLSNFSNITFDMPNGSINIIGKTEINGTQLVSKQRLNITNNNAFVNTVNLTFFNSSAIIILRNLSHDDPFPVVDYEDDGSTIDCPDNVCTEFSFSGAVFVFNVSHFTGYGGGESPIFNFTNITVTKTDSPDAVEADAQLNYTIFVNVTGNGTAYNITVNETYDVGVIFDSASPSALTGTNNTFILGNLSVGTNFTINITVNVSALANGTLTNVVNVTFQNESSNTVLINVSESTTVNANFTILQCVNMSEILIRANASLLNFTSLTITEYNISPENQSFCGYTFNFSTVNLGGNVQVRTNLTINDSFRLWFNDVAINENWTTIITGVGVNVSTTFNITGSYHNASSGIPSTNLSFQVI